MVQCLGTIGKNVKIFKFFLLMTAILLSEMEV